MPDSGEHVSFRQGPVKLSERLADPADLVVTEWWDFQFGRAWRRITRPFPAGTGQGFGDSLAGIVTRYGHQPKSGLRGCPGQIMKQSGAGLLCGLGAV